MDEISKNILLNSDTPYGEFDLFEPEIITERLGHLSYSSELNLYIKHTIDFLYDTRIYSSTDLTNWTLRLKIKLNDTVTNYINEYPSNVGKYVGSLYFSIGCNNNQNKGTLLTSSDGINWELRINGGAGLYDIAWNGSIYCCVGIGRILTSTDGINWTEQVSPTTKKIICIATNGSLFVIGCEEFLHLYSSDGINWTQGFALRFNGNMIWDGNKFISLIETGIITSTDGINWVYSSPVDLFEFNVPEDNGTTGPRYKRLVAWNGSNLYVAVSDNKIAYSSDGLNWTLINDGFYNPISGIPALTGNYLFWNGNEFITWNLWSSIDGINWDKTKYSNIDNFTLDLVYAPEINKIFAYNTKNIIVSSGDGNWSNVGTFPYLENLRKVVWNGSILIALNLYNGDIWKSSDGEFWTLAAQLPGANFVYVFRDNSFLVSKLNAVIHLSSDALTWTEYPVYKNYNITVTDSSDRSFISYNATKMSYVVYDDFLITYMEDIGVSNKIIYAPTFNVFVRTSATGIWTSSDGVNWTKIVDLLNVETDSQYTFRLIYWTGTTVALIKAGVTGTSPDVFCTLDLNTNTFTEITTIVSNTNNPITSLCYDPADQEYIATTANEIYSSTDNGLTWQLQLTVANGKFRGCVVGNRAVVVGAVIYSRANNGTWTLRTSANIPDFYTVVYNGTRYVAAGMNTSELKTNIMTSTDGINWSSANQITSLISFDKIIWTGTQFVAVPFSGATRFYVSSDGLTWTQNTSNPYFTSSRDLAYNGSRFLIYQGLSLSYIDAVTLSTSHPVVELFTNYIFNKNYNSFLNLIVLRLTPSNIIYLLPSNGIFPYKTSSDGINFIDGIVDTTLSTATFSLFDNKILLKFSNGRYQISSDRGVTWTEFYTFARLNTLIKAFNKIYNMYSVLVANNNFYTIESNKI